MGIFDFKKYFSQKNHTVEDNQLYRALYQTLYKDNVRQYDQKVETFIQEGYIFNPHTFTVINYIARNLSQVKFNVFEIEDEKSLQQYRRHKELGNVAESNLFKHKALNQVSGTSLSEMIEQPNEFQSWSEFLFELIGYKKLTGNSFIWGLNPTGFSEDYFSKIYNVPSNIVEIVDGEWLQPIKGYKLAITHDRKLDLEPEKVLHIKEWNPQISNNIKSPYGLSPMCSLTRTLQKSNESYNASLKLLQNGVPAGILSNGSERMLTAEQTDKLEQAYQKKFGGGKNKNKVLFASSQVSWQSIGMSSVEMELLESNKADLRDFARVFGIPVVLLSDTETSTYNNINEAKKSVWQELLIPELNIVRDHLNRWLAPAHSKRDGKKYFIDFDTSDVPSLQADLDTLSARLLKEQAQGLWTANEVKVMLGKPTNEEDANLDKHILNSTFRFIEGDEDEDKTLAVIRSLSPLVQGKLFEKLTEEEVRSLLKL